MNTRSEILAELENVPALPVVASNLMSMLQDRDAATEEIINTIEVDPGLTANMLRQANSALYGGSTSVSSIREALVRLGTQKVLELAMTAAIGPLVGGELKGYDMVAGRLWLHSVSVAIGTQFLAEALKVSLPDHAFTAGLLHDVGKIVMGTFVNVDTGRILAVANENEIPFEAAEREVLGIDHAELGAELLKIWEIPEKIVQVVRYHHDPESFPTDPLVVDLVHMADILSLQSGIGSGDMDGLHYRRSSVVSARRKLKALEREMVLGRMMTAIMDLDTAQCVDLSVR